jgi:hypothetical protein
MPPFQRNNQSLPYAVGNRVYNGFSPSPRVGPVADRSGYKERDLKYRARRNAVLRRMKAKSKGKHLSADALRELGK